MGLLSPEPERPIIGEWNHLEASVGARGMGKSTEQCVRARQLQTEAHGAYVIGHSLGARLPTKPPPGVGGPEYPITYHTSLDKLERGLRRHPGRWHILSPPLAGDGHKVDPTRKPETADDLLHFAMRLSTGIRRKAWETANPFRRWKPNVSYHGIECVPIIVIIDEGIAIDAASTTKKEANKWFLSFIYSIRHLHIAMLYAIQNSNARSWQILEQSTVIKVFAIHHEWALNALRAAGATEEQLEGIKTQGKYKFVPLTALDVKTLEVKSEDKVPE